MLVPITLIAFGAPDADLLPFSPLASKIWALVDSLKATFDSIDPQGLSSDWSREPDAKWPYNFEYSQAEILFAYTTAAYCSSASIGALQCGSLCDEIAPAVRSAEHITVIRAPHTETQTLVANNYLEDLILVATRGTTGWDLSYWIIDMGAFPQRVPDYCSTCFVHSAFYGAYGAVKRDVYVAIWSAMEAEQNLVPGVVGHSAGGATAYLTAIDISKNIGTPKGRDNIDVRYLITYGAPRVGNAAFVAELQAHVGTKHGVSEGWRCIQGNDPVPFTIPALIGYVHALPEVWLSENSQYKICQPPDTNAWLVKEDPTCSGLSIFLDMAHHGNYFGSQMLTKIISCGMLNEENAYYNSTIDTAIIGSMQRSASSWMPF